MQCTSWPKLQLPSALWMEQSVVERHSQSAAAEEIDVSGNSHNLLGSHAFDRASAGTAAEFMSACVFPKALSHS